MDVSPSVIAFLASLGGQFRCKEYQAISDHKVQNQVLFGFGHPVPMFSSRSFMVSGLTFRSLIHLSLFLCMVLESVLVSFFDKWLTSFPSTSF